MSRIHLLILWILALVAGVIVFNTKNGKNDTIEIATGLAPGEQALGKVDLRNVTSVVITAGEDTTSAVQKDKRWFVAEEADFPVNIQTLSKVFDDLQDAKIVQAVAVEEEYYDRFHLDPNDEKATNRPKSITLKSGEEDLSTIFIGKKAETKGGQGSGSGRYIRMSHDDSGVYVIKGGFENLQAKSADWITKSLTLLAAPIKVEVKAAEGASYDSWIVARPTAVDEFILENLNGGRETDDTKTADLKTFFTQVNFTDLLNEQEVKDLCNEKDQREVTVTDSSGAQYLFTVLPEKVEPPAKTDDKEAPAAPAEPANFVVSFKILNGPTEPEKPAADASVQKQAEYQALLSNRNKLAQNVELQKTLEGRNFKIAATHLKAINKTKNSMEKTKKVSVTTSPVQVPMADPNKSQLTSPPVPGSQPPAPKKRIEAVTPPIAIPPRPPVEKETTKEETPAPPKKEEAPKSE